MVHPSLIKKPKVFSANMKKRFVLLDRDGTIITERNYLAHPDEVKLIPGAAKALKKLSDLGFGLLVITNQAGVRRGYFDLKTLKLIHDKLTQLLSQKGVFLDGIYFCPHTPEDNCLCRKPRIGMVKKAIKKHNFDPKLCFVVGDKVTDIELGRNIGAITILVKTGYGKETSERQLIDPDYVADNLETSVEIIKRLIKT